MRGSKVYNSRLWRWDGNRDAPTLRSSIIHRDCGWHGYLTAGKWIDFDDSVQCDACGEMKPRDEIIYQGRPPRLDWVIVGGEGGPGARPMHPNWARSLRDQCLAAGVPFHFKQWGEWVDADQHLAQVRAQGKHLYFDEGDALNDGWQPKLPLSFDSARDLAAMLGGKPYEHQSDGTTLIRVGKKAAGRLLDGIEHNGFPA